MPLYAAYGSDMHPKQMRERCPHSPQSGSGWVVGWRLTFGGEDIGLDGSLVTVVEDEIHSVFVSLYDVATWDEGMLDTWVMADQGVYRKIKLRVHTLDGDVLAWVYVLNAYEGGLPSARYLSMLAEAAEAAGAPDDYVTALRMRPTRESQRQEDP